MATEKKSTWLDNVLTVPVVGLRIKPNFQTAFRYSEAVIAAVQARFPGSDLLFTADGPLRVVIDLQDGFNFDISHENIVVKFQYKFSLESEAGALPTLPAKEISRFSDLLGQVVERVLLVVDPITALGGLSLTRIGIHANCKLHLESLPPGVMDLLSYLQKPWKGPLLMSDTTLLAQLEENDVIRDQCHHILRFNKTRKPEEVDLILDWQRLFKNETILKNGTLRKLFPGCIDESQAYFEKVAEGILEVG